MKESTTEIIIRAMRILANDIQSGDGVANAAIHEAAERLEQLDRLNQSLSSKSSNQANQINQQQHQINQLKNQVQEQNKLIDAFVADDADWNKLADNYEGKTKELARIILADKLTIDRLSSQSHINKIKAKAVTDFFTNYLIDMSSILDAPVIINGTLKDADGDYLHRELVSRFDNCITQIHKGE